MDIDTEEELYEIIELFHDLKKKRTELQIKEDEARAYIEEMMLENELHEINTGNIKCTLKEVEKQTVSNVCLPANIWEQYKRDTMYNMITTKETRQR